MSSPANSSVLKRAGYALEGLQHNYKNFSILSGKFPERKRDAFHKIQNREDSELEMVGVMPPSLF